MSKISKYQVVERAIRDAIIDGTLKVGDQLMTEEELCARFGFSRTTIGKALDNLRAHGYIERIAGRGTFVKAAHVEKQAGSSKQLHRGHGVHRSQGRREAHIV